MYKRQGNEPLYDQEALDLAVAAEREACAKVCDALAGRTLSLIHISEPTRLLSISYAVFCLKKKKKNSNHTRLCHHAGRTDIDY